MLTTPQSGLGFLEDYPIEDYDSIKEQIKYLAFRDVCIGVFNAITFKSDIIDFINRPVDFIRESYSSYLTLIDEKYGEYIERYMPPQNILYGEIRKFQILFAETKQDLIQKAKTDPTFLRNLIECSFVLHYYGSNVIFKNNEREIKSYFNDIVTSYKAIPNIKTRTTTSKAFQQFSTPPPMAYLCGIYALVDKVKRKDSYRPQVLEPTAGTGLMSIAFDNRTDFYFNELEDKRYSLLTNYFAKNNERLTQFDASTRALPDLYARKMDIIVANPPFDSLTPTPYRDPLVDTDTWRITKLDHIIALRALECMKDDGKAAIIVGGPNGPKPNDVLWREQFDNFAHFYTGTNRIFYNYLYTHYNVEDILNVSGDLYARQGTRANTRLILINGRKTTPDNTFYQQDVNNLRIYETWEAIYDRIIELAYFISTPPTHFPRILRDNDNTPNVTTKKNDTAAPQKLSLRLRLLALEDEDTIALMQMGR